jgi:hypothetical protein
MPLVGMIAAGREDRMDEGGTMEDIVTAFVTAIEQLLHAGYALPMHCTAVGLNGALMHVRYEAAAGALSAAVLADQAPDAGFTVPINVLFVDAKGQAARLLIGGTGTGPNELTVLH